MFSFAPQIIFIFTTDGLYGPKGGVIASIVLSAGYTQNRYLINQGWTLNEVSYVKVENNTIFWYCSNNFDYIIGFRYHKKCSVPITNSPKFTRHSFQIPLSVKRKDLSIMKQQSIDCCYFWLKRE